MATLFAWMFLYLGGRQWIAIPLDRQGNQQIQCYLSAFDTVLAF